MTVYHYHWSAQAETKQSTRMMDGIYKTTYPITKMDGYEVLKRYIRSAFKLESTQAITIWSLSLLHTDEEEDFESDS